MEKKFLKVYIFCACILFGMCALSVILIDPFGYYHKPWFGLKLVSFGQEYQNPGYARNYDYETVLLGTSMTEGMRASETDEIFETKTIKICESGAFSSDMALMLELACDDKDTKNVIMGLDANILRRPSDKYRSQIPLYLYNNNVFDDVEYVFNKEVIFGKCWQFLNANKNGNTINIDDLYIRANTDYSKEATLESYARAAVIGDGLTWDMAGKNIANIEPYIQNNPDITFYIYMPPYSILFWDRYMLGDVVEEELEMHKQVVETFIKYDNVKFYYFMNDYETITNLDNYKDSGHYSPAVCSELLQKMQKGEYLVSKSNYIQVFEELEKYLKEYDYDAIFESEVE